MNKKLKFGLLGKNISYSKSPQIFSCIFELDNIDGEFILFDTYDNQLERTLNEIVRSKLIGFSVTIPHKVLIMPFLNEIDVHAKNIGAINSVSVKDNKLIGFNTDYKGFAKPLGKYSDMLKNGKALILGQGGSSKAVIYSLFKNYDFKHYTIVGRSPEKLKTFKTEISNIYKNITVDTISFNNLLNLNDSYSIIVNCTPLGGPNYQDRSPLPDNYSFHRDTIYYDLNYNSNNFAVSKAEKAGISVLNGVPMLIAQAIESYNLWTGGNISFEEVFDKLKVSF